MSPPAMSGAQKAALVLLSLDESVASEVLKHLGEDEIRRLAENADRLSGEMTTSLSSALEEFERNMGEVVLAHDAGNYLRQLTVTSLGNERAGVLFAPSAAARPQPLETIRAARASALAELLTDENTQLAAVILSQLGRAQAAQVLALMPTERQGELLGRVATLETLPAEMIAMASEALAGALQTAGNVAADDVSFNGIAFAAGLLNELPPSDSERLLAAVDVQLAPRVRDAMFTFEDLLRLDTRSVQLLMRDVPGERLLAALKTAGEELREHFLGAVSSRAAETLREDLQAMPPMRLSDVEAAQREILEITTRLAQAGRFVLPTSGQEKLV